MGLLAKNYKPESGDDCGAVTKKGFFHVKLLIISVRQIKG